MLFNSVEFLFLFLPLSYLGFRILGRLLPGAVIGWLVLLSLFFYAWWNPKYLVLLLTSALTNYYLGKAIASCSDELNRRLLTAIGIAFNLGLLAFFKYASFLISTLSTFFEYEANTSTILLPLAISFFTFQQIAYLVDVQSNQKAEESIQRYFLFVTFFPQLIAGPIVHHKELLPQLTGLYGKYDRSVIAPAITLIILGLSKKVLIADTLAGFVDPGFELAETGAQLHAGTAWLCSSAYTLQLYFDFSGYCDIALGCALLFGIRLPLNFESPLKATSVIEFWRRWHMTLSQFLRDYLYIPLGGNKKGSIRRYVNLFITMLLGGLWHGAGWTFVFWGALHGIFLIVNHTWRNLSISKRIEGTVWKIVSFLATFSSVMFAFVFFRATDFDSAVLLIEKMLTGIPLSLDKLYLEKVDSTFNNDVLILAFQSFGTNLFAVSFTLLTLVIALIMPNSVALVGREQWGFNNQYASEARELTTLRWQNSPIWAVICGCLFTLITLSLSSVSPFLYFQF